MLSDVSFISCDNQTYIFIYRNYDAYLGNAGCYIDSRISAFEGRLDHGRIRFVI
jgi:hypothetical protein